MINPPIRYLFDNDVFFAAIYAGHVQHVACRNAVDEIKPKGWGIATETFLASLRLFMNPTIMGKHLLRSSTAWQVIDTELQGDYPGQLVYASTRPDLNLFKVATGHKQIMDIWLIQLARAHGCKLLTRDNGLLSNWPKDTQSIS
jgi:hypothetical protein